MARGWTEIPNLHCKGDLSGRDSPQIYAPQFSIPQISDTQATTSVTIPDEKLNLPEDGRPSCMT